MEKKKLKDLLEVFLTLQITKELPRQGFFYSGFKRNEADSVAAHSYSVTAFSFFLARELKKEGKKIDTEKVVNIALVHDMGEAITGDVGTYVKDLMGNAFDKIENKAFFLLVRNLADKAELVELFDEYQNLKSIESQIVKMADLLDALAQGLSTPGANMKDWKIGMSSFSKKKIKDRRLLEIFMDCVALMTNREVTYFREHIEKSK